MNWTLYGFLIAFIVCFVWILTGYLNYRHFRKNLTAFNTKYHYLIKMEKNAGHISTQAEFFNRRETLVSEYSFLYEEMKKMNAPKYWHKTCLQYCLMGFIYNIT